MPVSISSSTGSVAVPVSTRGFSTACFVGLEIEQVTLLVGSGTDLVVILVILPVDGLGWLELPLVVAPLAVVDLGMGVLVVVTESVVVTAFLVVVSVGLLADVVQLVGIAMVLFSLEHVCGCATFGGGQLGSGHNCPLL